MPEGPELHLASRFVNRVCKGRVFTGRIVKSPVHKSDEVSFCAQAYIITAASRGKEMQLILSETEDTPKSLSKGKKRKLTELKSTRILFRFGMSGKFQFTTVSEVHKHAHLQFFTNDDPTMVLSHVDVRRFGRWEVDADWSKDRGPDPMFEYQPFRSNVVKNLESSAFDRPICEVLLNQKYFNGIGNYLRAEILYRLGIPPFEKARNVLKDLDENPPDVKPKMKGQDVKVKDKGPKVDILHLCHTVPLEVVNLGGGGYDPEGRSADYSKFNAWLQCYYQTGMNNVVDHNSRTIWFKGPAGPMAPKDMKSRSPVKRRKKKEAASAKDNESPTKKPKKTGAKMKVEGQSKRKTPNRRQARTKGLSAGRKPVQGTKDETKKVKNTPKQTKKQLQGVHDVKGYATRSKVTMNDLKNPKKTR
ncbi:endonuclease 8-like 1 [Acanthaster planci]|uniref:Endonuclease 8-like 1 n=1 Tax=Acanthaster planci TaxID=133434 RepID=A0A8B8A240_ACAPL|nr:endonuclease 8-like 1 [Acanthaster planci]